MEQYNISTNELNERANNIAKFICNNVGIGKVVKLFGVPNGGLMPVILVHERLPHSSVVADPREAAYFIDDIIDSGATMRRMCDAYPEKPFFALVDKLQQDSGLGWVVFPWEDSHELTDCNSSADDIARRLLQYVGEDVTRGGLLETPTRFLKAWKHFTSGYDKNPADVLKVFEDGAQNYNQMVLVKNIPVYSQCEHHLVPFFGVAHIAYIPNGNVVGLSKLSRVVDIFARRLQVQERLTNQIANELSEALNPVGVGVVLECRHMCMEARGISQQGSTTITSSMKGVFMDDESTKKEFLQLIK